MYRHWTVFLGLSVAACLLLRTLATGEEAKGRSPEELPRIPQPDARAAQVPEGYHVEVVIANLTYPTSIEFDDVGTMYVAEGGYIYGDDVAPARILRFPAKSNMEVAADQLCGPITDLLWHDNRLFISQRGKISVLEPGGMRDLVTGLPSLGDHHNNQLTVGPDGKIYFGQGTATNSGVVGLDNYKMGWLAKYPEVRDVPAKDIRLRDQAFETPDPLTMLANKRNGQDDEGKAHEGHVQKSMAQNASQGHEGRSQKASPHEVTKHGDYEKGQEPARSKEHKGHAPAQDAKKAPEKREKTQSHPAGHGHEARGKPESSGDRQKHEGHEKGKESSKAKQPAGHAPAPSDTGQGHEGHGSTRGHADREHAMVKSFAFNPFGKTPPDDGAILGTVKASGAVLRMNLDGSDLEMYAWGLRNPFGLMWGPNGVLFASDNGYDERGSRPIAHAPDCLWVVKQDAWYGFPDFAGGIPVTDAQFAPEHGPAPKFLMRDHPNVEKPLVALTHHVGAAKIDFSRSNTFGYAGHLFMALSGDMNPITGAHENRSGFEVVAVNPETGKVESFFRAKQEARGPKGMEYVATGGPRRPVDVRFSANGNALYVVDVGAMAILSSATGPTPRPFPRTGVIWRITRGTVPEKSRRSLKGASNDQPKRMPPITWIGWLVLDGSYDCPPPAHGLSRCDACPALQFQAQDQGDHTMLRTALPIFVVAVAMALFAGQSASADDKAHEGTVVAASDGKLTMTFKGDEKKHSHDVAKDAKIVLDGKASKLEDLKAGFHAMVTMNDKHVVTKIEAHSKAK